MCPKWSAVNIFAIAKNHQINELAIKDSVCKNVQKTKAYHTKKFVTLAIRELPNKIWNNFLFWLGELINNIYSKNNNSAIANTANGKTSVAISLRKYLNSD